MVQSTQYPYLMPTTNQLKTYLQTRHQELQWAIDNSLTTLERVVKSSMEDAEKMKELKTEIKQQLKLW